jgi:hypothetical protein
MHFHRKGPFLIPVEFGLSYTYFTKSIGLPTGGGDDRPSLEKVLRKAPG